MAGRLLSQCSSEGFIVELWHACSSLMATGRGTGIGAAYCGWRERVLRGSIEICWENDTYGISSGTGRSSSARVT
jgi:hypothetical protein